jgi:molybdopterin/thiamine biosynthesis adenylyltransferase
LPPWFERFPSLFEQEKEILLRHGFVLDEGLLATKREVVFQGALPIDGERQLVIIFQTGFPSLPPIVCDKGDRPLLRRHHQPSTRQFCLFGPGNSRWSAGLTSEDLIKEVTDLLTLFGAGTSNVGDDHIPEPASAVLSYYPGVALLVPPPISLIEPDVSKKIQGGFIVRCDSITKNPDLHAQGILLAANIGGRNIPADTPYKDEFDRRGTVINENIVFLGKIESGEILIGAVKEHIASVKCKTGQWFCFMFIEQSGTAESTRIAWLFARHSGTAKPEFFQTFAYRPDDRAARIPSLKGLSEKTISIVGCGCLGSKIATALAASGVKNFNLIDRDFYEPNNAVRQEVSVHAFGAKKVNALAVRLEELNPEVEISPLISDVGRGSVEEDDELTEMIKSSDLVVETTGAHAVSRLINDRCFVIGTPAVFVSVTNGAWAGEVVRVIPGETACWLCWNVKYRDTPPPGEPTTGVFPPGCGQPSFTGSTFDTGIVANLGVSVVVQTLLRQTPNLPQISGDYLVWIGRNATGDHVLKADVMPIPSDQDACFAIEDDSEGHLHQASRIGYR